MFEKIAEIITEYVEVPREEITEETSFLSELKMNSLDIMTMVAELEDTFDITIETEDLNDIRTVGDLTEYINERMSE